MAAFTLHMNRIEVLGRHRRALAQAEHSIQNQLRALLRRMHLRAAHAGTLLADPAAFATYLDMLSAPDIRLGHAGDHALDVTHSRVVPAWLRKPPVLKKGVWPKAQWHPATCLWTPDGAPRAIATHILYTQARVFHPGFLAINHNFTNFVEALPIWADWAATIRGISAAGLGAVLAETGDLYWYSTVAKVWKRCGVGLYQGERQRRKANVSAQEAHDMAYDPQRRSVLYMTQIGLRNQNTTKDGRPGVYRQLYLDRYVLEMTKAPALPKKAWDARAMRYMVKRFLRDLWLAWRQTMPRPAEIPVMQEAVAWAERQVLAAAD